MSPRNSHIVAAIAAAAATNTKAQRIYKLNTFINYEYSPFPTYSFVQYCSQSFHKLFNACPIHSYVYRCVANNASPPSHTDGCPAISAFSRIFLYPYSVRLCCSSSPNFSVYMPARLHIPSVVTKISNDVNTEFNDIIDNQ